MKNWIPNLLTLSNLLSGCFGLAFVYTGHTKLAATMILLALIFDFLDGFAARMLNAQSGIGKELDSLADLVSFGVLPAFLAMDLIQVNQGVLGEIGRYRTGGVLSLAMYVFIFTIGAALRLARFNQTGSESKTFLGLPSPAAALFLGGFSLCYAYASQGGIIDRADMIAYVSSPWLIFGSAIAMALLMNTPLRMFSLKIEKKPVAEYWPQILLILGSVVLILLFGVLASQLIVLLYLILALIHNLARK